MILSYHYSHTHRTLTALVDGQPLGQALGNGPFEPHILARFKADCERIVSTPERFAAWQAHRAKYAGLNRQIVVAAMADRREREAARAGVAA